MEPLLYHQLQISGLVISMVMVALRLRLRPLPVHTTPSESSSAPGRASPDTADGNLQPDRTPTPA